MTFPAPHPVAHYAYTGSDTVTDELGNMVDSWSATPTQRLVQGWRSVDSERLGNSAQGEVFDVMMSLPNGWLPGIHDRFELPDGLYEVTGFRVQDNGFHGWRPGNVVLLKRATGII